MSGVFGDPHLSTFDRVRFDCQAAGEFTTVTSLETPQFKIQERFTSVSTSILCPQASVSTGVAIAETGLPTIQVSIPRGDSSGTEIVGFCPVNLFVASTEVQFSEGTGTDAIKVLVSGSQILIEYPLTGLQVSAEIRRSSSFGCHLLVQVFLPFSYRRDETLLGLLGTPNRDRSDDWVAPDGSKYTLPADQPSSLFGPAFNYCVENWCVRKEVDSIFSYRQDESFSSIYQCETAYDNSIESALDNVSGELKDLCGADLRCVIDGLCGTIIDARQA